MCVRVAGTLKCLINGHYHYCISQSPSKKTEATLCLSDRTDLVKGVEVPRDGRTEKPNGETMRHPGEQREKPLNPCSGEKAKGCGFTRGWPTQQVFESWRKLGPHREGLSRRNWTLRGDAAAYRHFPRKRWGNTLTSPFPLHAHVLSEPPIGQTYPGATGRGPGKLVPWDEGASWVVVGSVYC